LSGHLEKIGLIHRVQLQEGNFDCLGSAVDGACSEWGCFWKADDLSHGLKGLQRWLFPDPQRDGASSPGIRMGFASISGEKTGEKACGRKPLSSLEVLMCAPQNRSSFLYYGSIGGSLLSSRFARETECRFSKARICPAFLNIFILGVLFLVMGAVTGNGILEYSDAPSLKASGIASRSVFRFPVAFPDFQLMAFDDHSVDPFSYRHENDSGECHTDSLASWKSSAIACHHTKTILSTQDHFFLAWRGACL
ncbi:MAG: hypothetical protein ACYCYP_13275, partial [Leptospirales bacterium]